MPYEHVLNRESVKGIFQAISAKVDDQPCCDWVGTHGAGHFVKMVHNGIEYGDMQLICEAYHLMKVRLSVCLSFSLFILVRWYAAYLWGIPSHEGASVCLPVF